MIDTDPYSAAAVRAYDVLEMDDQNRSVVRPEFITAELAKRPKLRRVLDMTCGTGAQCLHLAKIGYEVTASDLSQHMIDIAAAKARAEKLPIVFHCEDMCDISIGTFDAIVSMYNAIGHLETPRFLQTARNARNHLSGGGIYAFDIFDRSLMHLMPSYRLIDRMRKVDNTVYVRFSHFQFDQSSGKVSVDLQTFVQKDFEQPSEIRQQFTLQTYTPAELRQILSEAGFDQVQITPGSIAVPDEPVAGLMNFGIAVKY